MKKKVGLALGGGAVLGAAHIGVLRTIKENEIPVNYISGTSIGAFVAALYAFGKGWEEIRDIAMDISWSDISKISLTRFGLLSNKKIRAVLTKHIGDSNIEEANIPLAIVATDVTSGEKIVLDKGSVVDAVMASTCLPGIFKPVEINGRMLVDGGIVENVPINTVKKMGAKYIIGIDLNAKHSYKKPENILDIIANSFHYIMQTSASLQTEKADILIQPDLSSFNRKDLTQVEKLMAKGYEDSKSELNKGNQTSLMGNAFSRLFSKQP